MKGRSIFYRWLGRTFWLSVVVIMGYTRYYMDQAVPDRMNITGNGEGELSFDLPLKAIISSDNQEAALANENSISADQITISGRSHFSIFKGEKGGYQVGPKLFGVIKLKDTQVDVVNTRYVVPCSSPMGIYLELDGVTVTGTGCVTGNDGMEMESTHGILGSGDYIEAFNKKPINIKEDLIRTANELDGQECVLQVRGGDENVDVSLKPVQGANGQYKLGIWVRDDTQGIGTTTYADMNGRLGTLSHGISDSDIGDLVESSEEALYSTEIMGIEKGSMGKPRLLFGVIYYGPQSHMGDIEKDTNGGVFGTVNQQLKKQILGEPTEITRRQGVKQGPACIRSNISDKLRDCTTEIQRVDYSSGHKNKSTVIRVTDPELLELTGRIVQGMSGSSAIQDRKLVGMVTRMSVQDVSRRYGILIENILE